MKVILKTYTPNPDNAVYEAACVCYDSTADKEAIITHCLKSGHMSVIEHASFTFKIEEVSRCLSHQLVRHRLASYCLAGDTEVVAHSKKRRHPKRWTLAQLYDWSKDYKRKGRLKLITLRSVNDKGIICPEHMQTIIFTGVQQIYQVNTECGRSIKSTQNHQFLTVHGWKMLSELQVGDRLIANGIPAYKSKEWIRELYLVQNLQRKEVAKLAGVSDVCLGKWIRKFGLQKPKSQYPNRQGNTTYKSLSFKTKEKIRKAKLGENNWRWKGNNASQRAGNLRAKRRFKAEKCEACGITTGRIERHHIDGNTLNNSVDNIKILCDACHKAWHVGQAVLAVYSTQIVSIVPIGKKPTYDIEMAGPNHNFVANGLVVHNSQRSQRYCDEGDFGYVNPPTISGRLDSYYLYTDAIGYISNVYRELIEKGIPKEDARYILPNACHTELVMTMNARSLYNFFSLRCCNRAQWEIREMANQMLDLCKKVAPIIFSMAGRHCDVYGKCNQKNSCGEGKEK